MKVSATTTLTVAPRGEDAVVYGIVPSQSAVSIKWVNGQKVPSVDTLTFRPTKTVGSDSPVTLDAAALAAEGLWMAAETHGDGSQIIINPLQEVNVEAWASGIDICLYPVGDTVNPVCKITVPFNLDGKDGQDGTSVTIVSSSVKYALSDSSARPADSLFVAAFPAVIPKGKYLWTRTEIVYNADNGRTVSYSVSRIGEDGGAAVPVKGDKGDYQFTHFAYALDVTFATAADGSRTPTAVSGFSPTPFDGARYIGVYSHTLDGAASDEEVDAAKQDPGADQFALYEWSLYVGDDAVNLVVSPQTVFLKKGESARTHHRVYVDLYKGANPVPYDNDGLTDGFECSTLSSDSYLDSDHFVSWSFNVDNSFSPARFYYDIRRTTAGAQADVSLDIPFKAIYNGSEYNSTIHVRTYADGQTGDKGDRGPTLRGPQYWVECPVGFPFQAGADNDTFLDVVIYNDNFYSCKTSHAKTAQNFPGSSPDQQFGYWQLASKFDLVATKILLAKYALIKNLGVETIDMRDASGNILFQAKDGNVICKTGTFENVVFSGLMRKKKTVVTAANFNSIFILRDNEDYNDMYDVNFALSGTWLEIQYLPKNIIIYPKALRALCGNTVLIYNKSSHNFAISAPACTSFDGSPGSFNSFAVSSGQFASLECKIGCKNGTEVAYFLAQHGSINNSID